jgi:hypothetical protein
MLGDTLYLGRGDPLRDPINAVGHAIRNCRRVHGTGKELTLSDE